MSTPIIGLAGPAGVGKTTAAKWLQRSADYKLISFANPLKESLVVLTGLDLSWFTDQDKKEREIPWIPNITPRKLMQLFATEFIRDVICHDFFIQRMQQQISQLMRNGISLVIDDVRFDNEANLIRENDGVIVHLQRNFTPKIDSKSHASEKGVSIQSEDYVLNIPDHSTELAFYRFMCTNIV